MIIGYYYKMLVSVSVTRHQFVCCVNRRFMLSGGKNEDVWNKTSLSRRVRGDNIKIHLSVVFLSLVSPAGIRNHLLLPKKQLTFLHFNKQSGEQETKTNLSIDLMHNDLLIKES